MKDSLLLPHLPQMRRGVRVARTVTPSSMRLESKLGVVTIVHDVLCFDTDLLAEFVRASVASEYIVTIKHDCLR